VIQTGGPIEEAIINVSKGVLGHYNINFIFLNPDEIHF
jgi:hypothetical protein